MSSGGNNRGWQPVDRKFVRVAIIVAALLLVRSLVDQLPMLYHARPIVVSALLAPEEWQFLARLQSQQAQAGQMFPDDQLFGWLPGYILPVSLANAVIDTLILIAILLGAAELSRLIRGHASRLPELGTITFLVILAVVTGLAYRSYAGVALPLLGTNYGPYDWLFLILALTPILAAILLGYRKLDVITDMVLQFVRQRAGGVGVPHQTGPADCPSCGKSLTSGARFCAECGAPVSASEARPVFCTACGARNDKSARTCARCGALSAAPS